MVLNVQAEELNEVLRKNNATLYNLLSEKGKEIFFPKKGIISQGADARKCRLNATLGVATRDDGTPMRLSSIDDKILLDPEDVFLYAPSYGKKNLREAWKNEIKKKNLSLKGDISLPVVTNGITNGLNRVGYLFVDPGDRIILPDKLWGNYRLIFENAFGGNLVSFNMLDEDGFDIDGLGDKLLEGEGKKIVLLNFPNNPTGYTPTVEEARKISDVIRESAGKGDEVCVICDDAYFGLIYGEGIFRESIFSLLADLDENVLAVKVDGATKELYVWGLRVGFITYGAKGISAEACNALESKTAGAIRNCISNVSNLSQSLIYKALKSETFELEQKEKYEILKGRFQRVKKVLESEKYSSPSSPFSLLPFNSGYFMCVELKPELDAEKVRKTLLTNYDTGIIVMGNLIRIAYSSVAERDIEPLFESIYDACKENM